LSEAGIDDPVRELAAFVRAPEAHAANVRARLVARCLETGEEHLAHKRTSAALAAFGRALALDASNAQARGRVERIRRRERLFKLTRRAIVALAALAVLGAAGWELRGAIRRARAAAATAATAEAKLAADRLARERAEPGERAKADRQAAPSPAPPTVPAEPARKRPAPPPPKVAEALDVRLHVRQHAEVTVDDRYLGDNTLFSLKLTPGPHRVLVHHTCCKDNKQLLTITKNQPGQMYKLEYGTPEPAQFKVLNAPPDARVVVDVKEKGPLLVGAASNPLPYSMTQPFETATVTIGDRKLSVVLKAGWVNTLDYAQATP